MTLEDFVSSYLYPGEFVEIAGLGPSDDSNPIRYSGPLEEIPKKLLSETVGMIAVSGLDGYTLRIECEL
jgi:hypothetical protein